MNWTEWFRTLVGIITLGGFLTATTLLIIVEWNKIRKRYKRFVSMFHRIRRILTGLHMIILLGSYFYGWRFLSDTLTIDQASFYMKMVATLFGMIILSLL